MNFEEMIQRAVNAEAKTGLRSSTMVWDFDAHCLRGHRPSHNTSLKVQTQRPTTKEPCTKESRPKKAKSNNSKTPALPRSDESAKPNYEKKRRK